MIINRTYRFTFVHVPKTGGSSIGQFLAPLLGPMDLQLGSWQETIASGTPFNRRIYIDGLHPSVAIGTLSRLLRLKDPVSVWDQAQKKRYRPLLGSRPQHAAAAAIRKFDPNSWHTHFKFAFVRNPFARMVSKYNFDKRTKSKPGEEWPAFSEYVRKCYELNRELDPYWDSAQYYCIDGKLALDFVGRFEMMRDDVNRLIRDLDLPLNISDFPHAKRAAPTDYRSYYGPEEEMLVRKLSAWEIDAFEYSF